MKLKVGNKFRFSKEFLKGHRERYRESYGKKAYGCYDEYPPQDTFTITKIFGNEGEGLRIEFISAITERKDAVVVDRNSNLFNLTIFEEIGGPPDPNWRQLKLF